ncbi:hypothetical protein Tco_1355914 [Tanacetum coccineum]
MGYEKLSQKLTFYKAFFSPQWKFLIHTVLQCLSAKTTAWNEFSSTMASAIICLATNQKFNFSKYIFESMVKKLDNVGKFLMYPRFIQVPQSSVPSDPTNVADEAVNEEPSMQLKELIDFCTKLQQRPGEHKDCSSSRDYKFKEKSQEVKEERGSRTHKIRKLYKVGRSTRVVSSNEASLGDQEDASKQRKKIHDIDDDEDITLENVHDDDIILDVSDLASEEVFVEKEVHVKEVSAVGQVNTATVSTASTIPVSAATITEDETTLAQALTELKSAKPTTAASTISKSKGLVIHEEEQAATLTVSSQQPSQIKVQDKGKGILVEEPVKMDDIQAKIEADQLLAERLQAREQEELTIEEMAKLFQQLLEKRRKFFKNMAGWKPKDLKNKSFSNIQELFDKAFKRVDTYFDSRTELVEGTEMEESSKKAEVMEESSKRAEIAQESSSKRSGYELEQENAKKQKAKMKEFMKIIPDEEEVAIDAISLAINPQSIVDWKIVKEGKISYYQIIRADGSSKRYSAFIQMLKSFDMEDLETLWKLVKAKHGYTRPEEGYERVLWGDLKTMFEHHVEDAVWRNLRESKVLVWKLFDSCGVHFVRFQNLHVFMLVEKRYPLTPATITDMLNKKLQADHWNEMCYQLLKLITKQLKNQ